MVSCDSLGADGFVTSRADRSLELEYLQLLPLKLLICLY